MEEAERVPLSGKVNQPSNGQPFMIFLVVCLTPDNEYMCSETDFTQEEACPSRYNLQEAGPSISPYDHLQDAGPFG